MDVHLLLAEWIRINQHPLVTDDICQSVVKKVSVKKGVVVAAGTITHMQINSFF
jgi:hypothetical protein